MLNEMRMELAASFALHALGIVLLFVGEFFMDTVLKEPKKDNIVMVRAMSVESSKQSEVLNRAAQKKKKEPQPKKKTQKPKKKKKTKPSKKQAPKKAATGMRQEKKKSPEPNQNKKNKASSVEKTKKAKVEEPEEPDIDEVQRAEERRKRLSSFQEPDPRPDGPKDREKTSREGSETNSRRSIGNNREWAKYEKKAKKIILSKWTDLAGDASLRVVIKVPIGPNGKLSTAKVTTKSGNDGFDRGALMAFNKVRASGGLPAPPAEFRDLAKNGVTFELTGAERRQ